MYFAFYIQPFWAVNCSSKSEGDLSILKIDKIDLIKLIG